MATFEVPLVQITIEEHPNADALELAAVGGFRAVVMKGRYQTGDWVAYVPEASVLPEWLLKQEGFWNAEKGKGMLAGSKGNRVKPIKLRGALSEGVCIKPTSVDPDDPSRVVFTRTSETGEPINSISPVVGDNLQEFFGIIKYEPPIPVHMSGECDTMHGWSISFDVENAKKYPDVLIDGEDVAITEKLHGTFCQMGYIPELDRFIVASKGLGARGLVFKLNDRNKENLYVRTALAGDYSLLEKVRTMAEKLNQPVYLLGEIFGRGVQDLSYGMKEPTFRAFDMYVGQPQKGRYVDFDLFVTNCKNLNIPMVPLLYRGPYSYDIMCKLTDGQENVSDGANIREGVVVKPTTERRDDLIGRVLMKHISTKYLTRRGNITEFT